MNGESTLLRTPLYEFHRDAGARIVEFGGWLMPVQYAGIVSEHRKVREVAGIFDLSHMGRVFVRGAGATEFLQQVATNDVSALAQGQVHYTLICNEQGGILDDILSYRLGESEHLLVVNASNRPKILRWLNERLAGSSDAGDKSAQVEIEDTTLDSVMIGLQGPRAMDILQPLTAVRLETLRYYHCASGEVVGVEGLVSRTGYTGEDGFEVILPTEAGRELWSRLAETASSGELALAGLGSRDTLRLEAGMPLYGHELSETVNPLEVGLGRFVRLEKGWFIGSEALKQVAAEGPKRRLIGLELPDRAIARQDSPVMIEGVEVGRVTSGSYSPTLDRSIAMALVGSGAADAGSSFSVIVRSSPHPAMVVEIPFFHRRKRKQGEQR